MFAVFYVVGTLMSLDEMFFYFITRFIDDREYLGPTDLQFPPYP